jgi:hypothetical protein
VTEQNWDAVKGSVPMVLVFSLYGLINDRHRLGSDINFFNHIARHIAYHNILHVVRDRLVSLSERMYYSKILYM